MPHTRHIACVIALCLVSSLHAAEAQKPRPIKGSLVIHGGGKLTDAVMKEFIKLGGAGEGKIVVIPTANVTVEEFDAEATIKAWKDRGFADVQVLHTLARNKVNDKAFVEPLTRATAVWLDGGLQTRLEKAYGDTLVEKELYNLFDRGGVIGGTSAGAAIMSRAMISGGTREPQMGTGFGFLPGALVDQHFTQRDRKPRLVKALRDHPGLAGYGIDEGTALVVKGRDIRVLGEGSVTIILPASRTRLLREIVLKDGQQADLMAMHRAAIAQGAETFPPEKMEPVRALGEGTLVIVGGGGTPGDALKAFIEAAGGVDAPLVVIPTALGDDPPPSIGEVVMLRRAGAKNVKVVHARTPADAAKDDIVKPLREAKGIWFSGGRQWRFVDSYENTPALEAMLEVCKKGGVIGGSSAGATIQGEYLVRGNPLGNLDMMAEGYERGFPFLTGVAIDQHFSQRNRFKDMEAVKRTFPQLLGFGIDESTAVIVKGTDLRVVGKGAVQIYDRDKLGEESAANYTKVVAGEKYDLKTRKKVE